MVLTEWQPVIAALISLSLSIVPFSLLAFFCGCFLFCSSHSRSCPFLGMTLVRLLLCFLLFNGLLNATSAKAHNRPVVYTREQLLALSQVRLNSEPLPEIPAELRRRRRGSRAEVKHWEWKRWYKPCLPSIITGNVRYILNKMDLLVALMQLQREYWDSTGFHFTETWLNELTSDSLLQLDGFHLIRVDRDMRVSGKKKGGGVGMFVNNKGCNSFPGVFTFTSSVHIYIKEQRCTRDIELLAVSIRLYYLPREFSHVNAITAYIPPWPTPTQPASSSTVLFHSYRQHTLNSIQFNSVLFI